MKTINFPKFRMIFILTASLFFIHCEKVANFVFSDKDDVKMGANFDKEIRSNKAQYKVLENEQIRSYVQSIVKELLKSKAISKKKVFPYRVTVLDGDDTVNAFCTPGGYIYVYTGLLKFLENEASLAAVLAHEIAHAERRHARQRMLSQMGVQLIVMAILGSTDNVLLEAGARIAGNLSVLHNSRGDEMEADESAFEYLGATKYYRGGMSFFFDKISRERKGSKFGKKLEGLFSTHPIPEDRLRKNEERIEKADISPPSEKNLFTDRYEKAVGTL